MEFFDDIDDPHEILLKEKMLNLDFTLESYEDIQEKYNGLHEVYIKEVEHSNKVKRSLGKCLKLYSKLCKKCEAQQKIIDDLQGTIKQKTNTLEETLQNQEKLKGVLEIYKTERLNYSDVSIHSIKREKEILLSICCKLISESVKTNTIKNLTNYIIRRFKKDLDEEKLNLLKVKDCGGKKEGKLKGLVEKLFENIPKNENEEKIKDGGKSVEFSEVRSDISTESENCQYSQSKLKLTSTVTDSSEQNIKLVSKETNYQEVEESSLNLSHLKEDLKSKVLSPGSQHHQEDINSLNKTDLENNGVFCDSIKTLGSTIGKINESVKSESGVPGKKSTLNCSVTNNSVVFLGDPVETVTDKVLKNIESSKSLGSISFDKPSEVVISSQSKLALDLVQNKLYTPIDDKHDASNGNTLISTNSNIIIPSLRHETTSQNSSFHNSFIVPEKFCKITEKKEYKDSCISDVISSKLEEMPGQSYSIFDIPSVVKKTVHNFSETREDSENPQSEYDLSFGSNEINKDSLIVSKTVINKFETSKSEGNSSNIEKSECSKSKNESLSVLSIGGLTTALEINKKECSGGSKENQNESTSKKSIFVNLKVNKDDFNLKRSSRCETIEGETKKLTENDNGMLTPFLEVYQKENHLSNGLESLNLTQKENESSENKAKLLSECGSRTSGASFDVNTKEENLSKNVESSKEGKCEIKSSNLIPSCNTLGPLQDNSNHKNTNMKILNGFKTPDASAVRKLTTQSMFDTLSKPEESSKESLSKMNIKIWEPLTTEKIESCSSDDSLTLDVSKTNIWTSSEKRLCSSTHNKMEISRIKSFMYDEELNMIFKEMRSVRLLSPIRDIEDFVRPKDLHSWNESIPDLPFKVQIPAMLSPIKDIEHFVKKENAPKEQNLLSGNDTIPNASSKGAKTSKFAEVGKKRTSREDCEVPTKRLKNGEESKGKDGNSGGGLLDSIISAMSFQNEVFRSNTKDVIFSKNETAKTEGYQSDYTLEETTVQVDSSKHNDSETINVKRKNIKSHSGVKGQGSLQTPKKENQNTYILEKSVMEGIKKFVSCSISSKEEAEKNVKSCLSVLENKPEEIIVKAIVALVFENIDEEVEIFERPAPPLTKTQHRLIILLSVFKSVDPNREKLPSMIQKKIWEKLFPDQFFWPDDSVETACRFYAALSRMRNDAKGFWKFCLQAMTDMKQRCSLAVFTGLKTWPDVLHDATTLKNNILAVTIANIFLHMPKTDGLRNLNQKKKLLALKHLLMNFYQFKVEETIEMFTEKVIAAVQRNEVRSEKALILLTKCRTWTWTSKHVLPKLKRVLLEWTENKVEDDVGVRVLSVMKKMCSIFSQNKEKEVNQAQALVTCLADVLGTRKLNHTYEESIVEILLQIPECQEARKIIREWVPKGAIKESIKTEIINASTEDFLKELKQNKRKETPIKKKGKKKKWKKKKGKEEKKKERRYRKNITKS